MFREGDEFQFAGPDFQAGRPFDLHQQLVGIDQPRAHLAAVVLEVEFSAGGLGPLELRVDVVYRCEQHRDELLARESFAFGQRIGEPQRGHARHMRAGHRRSLQVAVVRVAHL